jgi:hypothetical protein
MWSRFRITSVAAAPVIALALGACGSSHSGQAITAPISFTADPAASADLAQAEADVKRCVTGTPLQQIHTVHVLLLEKASGKNEAEVTATRARVFTCLGVPASQRTQFKNDALTAAEHGKVYTKAGVRTYLLVTLPALLNRYQHSPQGIPSPGTAVIPGTSTSPAASVSPSAKASSS